MTDFIRTRKIVFIAGPYSGEVRNNITNARILAVDLAKRGIYFVCPHTNSAYMEDFADYKFWTSMYHIILLRSDALLTFGQWQKSKGAKLEVELAQLNQIPVFHDIRRLAKWWRGTSLLEHGLKKS